MPITPPPDFPIHATGPVSAAFVARGIVTFQQACHWIAALRYGRNANKENLLTVFTDDCGTCSTKHALLSLLADEHHFTGLQLILGLVKMDGNNTPAIAARLARYQLPYLPEAHNYLKYEGTVYDYTKPRFTLAQAPENILEEQEITASQIGTYKVAWHRQYLAQWLASQPRLPYTPAEIWKIREQCILDLSEGNSL